MEVSRGGGLGRRGGGSRGGREARVESSGVVKSGLHWRERRRESRQGRDAGSAGCHARRTHVHVHVIRHAQSEMSCLCNDWGHSVSCLWGHDSQKELCSPDTPTRVPSAVTTSLCQPCIQSGCRLHGGGAVMRSMKSSMSPCRGVPSPKNTCPTCWKSAGRFVGKGFELGCLWHVYASCASCECFTRGHTRCSRK